MKIGISLRLADHFPDLKVVSPGTIEQFDVTIMLVQEDARWVDRVFRRIRPHFVRDAEEAKRVYDAHEGCRDGHL